jgi:DNA-binding transcriptional MerR regulator
VASARAVPAAAAAAILAGEARRATAPDLAAELGVHVATVRRYRQALIAEGRLLPRHRRWTLADREQINDLVQQGRNLVQIAQALRVSEAALERALLRWGLTLRGLRRQEVQVRTLDGVADLLGVPRPRVRHWVAKGWLKARRNGTKNRSAKQIGRHGGRIGDRRHARINDLDIQDFLALRAAWPSWEPAAIPDPLWREEAEELRRAAGGRWVKLSELAQRWHYSPKSAPQWLRSGRWPVEHTSWANATYIWETDGVALLRPPERRMPKLKYTYPLMRTCPACAGTYAVHSAAELHKKKTCGAPACVQARRATAHQKYTYPVACTCKVCGETYLAQNNTELHAKKTCGARACVVQAQRQAAKQRKAAA